MAKTYNRAIQVGGETRTIGTPVVTALEFDADKNVTRAKGASVPTDADKGYAVGCLFTQTDGGTETVLYVNEGTAASADFNPVLGGLAKTEAVAATNVITAAETGTTFFLNVAGGFTSTLPAPAAGLKFKFIVKTAPTTAYVITTNGGANILYGMMEERAGTAGVAGAARDTFNFVANQAIIGDWVEFESDGTNWYYHGMVDVAAGNTVAAT